MLKRDTLEQRALSRPISRREMLRRTASLGSAAAAAMLIAACGGDTSAPANTTSPTAAGASGATSAPAATSAGSGATSPTAESAGGATSATAATSASGAAATTPPAAQTSEPVTLRVWGFGLDDTRAKARLDTFTKANPNITIEPVGGSLNTQQLLTAVASGDPPEVVSVDRAQTGSWAGRNAIDPIDDLVSRDGFDFGQFYPFLKQQVTYKDKIYGVPQFVNLDLLFINLDVLKEVGVDPSTIDPGNWDQLTQLAEQLHKQEGETVTRTGFDTKVQDGRLWLWSRANGVDLISADGQKANFNDPKVVETLTWAKTTVDKQGGEKARAAFSQTQNFFSPQNPVLIGQTAMTLFEQWLIGVMKVDPKANFQVVIPRKRNSADMLTDATGSALAIPRGIQGAKREAAWKFIQGMTSTDAWLAGERATFDAGKAKNELYTPTVTGNMKVDQEVVSTIYQPIGASYDAAVKLLPDALKVANFRYSGPVASQIADLMTAAINDALQGVTEPQAALDDLQKNAQQAIDDFNSAPGVR